MLAVLLLVLALAPGTWLRGTRVPPSDRLDLRFTPVALPPLQRRAEPLGPFALERVWRMDSRHWRFGGFSALVPLGNGELLAIGDRGSRLRFSPPGAPRTPAAIAPIVPKRFDFPTIDAEAATIDRTSGQVWIAWEGDNSLTRHGLSFARFRRVRPRIMRDWSDNGGPEALARLSDGRFLAIREGFSGLLENRDHQALIFSGDPVLKTTTAQVLTMQGPRGFSPTDMARLPDGRVLILMRRMLWPIPARFAGRLAVADPRAIREGAPWPAREAARLEAPLPVDNFEGMAIEPRPDGTVTVWLISDDNGAVTQRTLLWKLSLDPKRLPGTNKRAREPARPSAGLR